MKQNPPESMNLDESTDVGIQQATSIQVLMKITDSIGTLRTALGVVIPIKDLSDFEIWLQDCKRLNDWNTLADDCQKVEGSVQLNLNILRAKKQIIILDVIQPTEEVLQVATNQQKEQFTQENVTNDTTPDEIECNNTIGGNY